MTIVDDSIPFVSHHKIIGAWGDSSTISYHGNNRFLQSSIQFFPFQQDNEEEGQEIHGTSHKRQSDNVYNVFLSEMDRRSEGYVNLILDSYKVFLQRTRYEDVCFMQSKLVELGLPLVTEDGTDSTSNLYYLLGRI